MPSICRNYSLENKQCRYNYIKNAMISFKDLKPHCIGYAEVSECCWYNIGKLTPFISDADLRKYRKRFKEQE